MNSLYASRRRINLITRTLCIAAAGIGIGWLVLILFTLLWNASRDWRASSPK
jgi:phosphate transport system permease protein